MRWQSSARSSTGGSSRRRFGAVYTDKAGHPPHFRPNDGGARYPQTHAQSLGRGAVRALGREPYYQLFCGEEFFQHKATFDRSSLTRWRQRMGEEKLVALIQESLSTATRTGAAKLSDFSKVIVDTTVQPKAVAFPTDAKLMHRARERLVRLAKTTGVELRQSLRAGGQERALIAHQPYAHAKQFKRANRALKTPPPISAVRDILRKGSRAKPTRASSAIRSCWRAGCARAAPASARAESLFAARPEVRCIGKGKAHRYELGSRSRSPRRCTARKVVSSSPTPRRLPGNPRRQPHPSKRDRTLESQLRT